jgi:Flp pilus assembly protein TadD
VAALPDNAFGYNNLGAALYDQGKLPESEAFFRKAIWLDPNHVQAHVNLGNVLDDSGRSSEAEGEYRQAIRLDPKYTLAYYNLAVVLIHQSRKEEAAEVLEAYLAQGGKNRDEAEAMIHNLRGH